MVTPPSAWHTDDGLRRKGSRVPVAFRMVRATSCTGVESGEERQRGPLFSGPGSKGALPYRSLLPVWHHDEGGPTRSRNACACARSILDALRCIDIHTDGNPRPGFVTGGTRIRPRATLRADGRLGTPARPLPSRYRHAREGTPGSLSPHGSASDHADHDEPALRALLRVGCQPCCRRVQ